MTLYRFAQSAYSRDLSGEGAKLFGGRWNNKGNAVVYTSSTISLALLELLIHSASYDEILVNQLTVIDTPTEEIKIIAPEQLKTGWQNDAGYSKFIGDEFLKAKAFLLMQVPSAIIQQESNILINPLHANFRKIKIKSVSTFHFDTRLFKA